MENSLLQRVGSCFPTLLLTSLAQTRFTICAYFLMYKIKIDMRNTSDMRLQIESVILLYNVISIILLGIRWLIPKGRKVLSNAPVNVGRRWNTLHWT